MAGSVGSEDGDIGFQIAPMVDVVFVLMLFFMACAGSQVVELEMAINLPGGGQSEKAAITPIRIDISSDGLVALNNQPIGQPADQDLTQLREWLTNSLKTFGNDDPLIISPSPDARHERIIQVLNAIAAASVEDPADPTQRITFKNLSFS
ncbi:MAG: biopolymer transporter ExbD [Chthoniobacteraceae bacterium]